VADFTFYSLKGILLGLRKKENEIHITETKEFASAVFRVAFDKIQDNILSFFIVMGEVGKIDTQGKPELPLLIQKL
jgi:hypothetical protein